MANLASEKSRRPGVSVWTIVVAGGSGRRFGSLKQYAELGDRRVVDLALDSAREVSDGVILVVPVDDAERERGVAGGPTRTASVRNGLAAVPVDADVILVHDAARPFASTRLFSAVVDAVCAGADGAVPGLPVTDTVKSIEVVESNSLGLEDSYSVANMAIPRVVSTPDRATLVAVQTPQAFRASILREAYRSEIDATDDSVLVESVGGTVVVVPGEVDNRKITHPDDLEWARDFLSRRTTNRDEE
ncbi:MAG: 2-C-methyl-D-erythritol 4-phosphate cytidylyltransferase [Actinomycetota bacterium]|jgi:2-C-methyl-D-erythritol 4-phosphate cytidylyltransferase